MRAGSEAVLELIGRIYDAAFAPALWAEALTRLTDALGGAQVCMLDHDPGTKFTAIIAPRHRRDYAERLRDDWLGQTHRAAGNVIMERVLEAPSRQPFDIRSLVTRDEFAATEFYNEWWRPQGFGLAVLGVKWAFGRGFWGHCCIHASRSGDDFDSRQATLFAHVAPHLFRAAELHCRLWRTGIAQELALAGLCRTETGVILVDAAERIVFANDTAAALVDARDGLVAEGTALSAADSQAASALGRLIAGCSSRTVVAGGPGGAIEIPRGGRPPLRILVAPFRDVTSQIDLSWLGPQWPAAIIVVTDPERERQIRRDGLRRRFGLTAAEAELALEVTKGGGREAAARRLGITVGTARTHLQRIFDKTGVHRQAELVGLVAEAGRETDLLDARTRLWGSGNAGHSAAPCG